MCSTSGPGSGGDSMLRLERSKDASIPFAVLYYCRTLGTILHPWCSKDKNIFLPATDYKYNNSKELVGGENRMGMEEQAELVAKAFVDHYFNLFDTNRSALTSLYHETSMLSFEGQKIRGMEEIGRKLTELPFDQCHHSVSTIDCQPSPFSGGIIVFVSGSLQLSGEEHQLKFSQMFQLIPTLQGSFYVHNDIFRLNYG